MRRAIGGPRILAFEIQYQAGLGSAQVLYLAAGTPLVRGRGTVVGLPRAATGALLVPEGGAAVGHMPPQHPHGGTGVCKPS